MSRDVRINEESKRDSNKSTEVIDGVEESSITVPTSISTEHEDSENEDEPLQPRM